MKYREAGPEEHVLEFSRKETDFFFLPFEKMDPRLSVKEVARGKRILRPEYAEWLIQNVGVSGKDWLVSGSNSLTQLIMFTHKHHALQFKLVWQGHCLPSED